MDDRQALIEDLVEQNLPYARALAGQLRRGRLSGIPFEELESFAMKGLFDAARHYDPSLGSFKTFAYLRIRGEMIAGARRLTGLTRAHQRALEEQRMLDEIARGAEPAPGASPEALGAQFANLAARAAVHVVVTDLADREDGQFDAPAGDVSPDDVAAEREAAARIREAIETLPPEQRTLVEALYVKSMSMTDYAAELGVNKATVSRRHREMLDALRAALAPPDPRPPG